MTWTYGSRTSSTGNSISDGSDLTSSAIDNDGKLGTEISVECAYGTTANEGIKVYVLKDADGTDYEGESDVPFGFELAFTVSTTHRRVFFVPGYIGDFKLLFTNDSGDSVTVDYHYRQAT